MITDTERLARIGELLRIRGLIMAAHEEQLERIDGRLRDLYPSDDRILTITSIAFLMRPHHLDGAAAPCAPRRNADDHQDQLRRIGHQPLARLQGGDLVARR